MPFLPRLSAEEESANGHRFILAPQPQFRGTCTCLEEESRETRDAGLLFLLQRNDPQGTSVPQNGQDSVLQTPRGPIRTTRRTDCDHPHRGVYETQDMATFGTASLQQLQHSQQHCPWGLREMPPSRGTTATTTMTGCGSRVRDQGENPYQCLLLSPSDYEHKPSLLLPVVDAESTSNEEMGIAGHQVISSRIRFKPERRDTQAAIAHLFLHIIG